MWKRVIPPTIVVCVLWVAGGFVTNYYTNQILEAQTRSMNEDLTTIDAAWRMRKDMWKIRAALSDPINPSPAVRAEKLDTLQDLFEYDLIDAEATCYTLPEKEIVKKVRSQFAEFKALLQAYLSHDPISPKSEMAELEHIFEVQTSIRRDCKSLSALNESLIHQKTDLSERLQSQLTLWQLSTRFVGPIIGLLYGLYIARRLTLDLTKIRIVLNDTTGQLGCELGTVNLAAADDLPVLHKQVQVIGSRVQNMLSELKLVRNRAIQSERLAAVGELAAGVAHEIRNPLTSVKLLIQNASQRQAGATLNAKQLDVILGEILRMEKIVQGLLDFAKPSELTRIRHDLRTPLEQALSLAQVRAERQHVDIRLALGDAPLDIEGDAVQMQSVFTNLIVNALDAMPGGGTLDIRAQIRDRTCQIAFADTGPGIAQDMLERIFEPFATNKDRGIGLGMAISQRIVREHGGSLIAANRSEGGRDFSVELQLASTTAAEMTERPAAKLVSTEADFRLVNTQV